jgi:hypothetical protein
MIEGDIMKALPEEPRCPFCRRIIDQPMELLKRKIVEFPLGLCAHCGAVYAYDATGHNLGAAFIEALLFACNEDDDLAFSLSYGEDYADAIMGNYDIYTHSIAADKIQDDRYVRGALLFVKLFEPYQQVTEDKIKEKVKYSAPITKTPLRSERFSKARVTQYVMENNIGELLSLAEADSRVINELQRMLYIPDEHLRWKIVDLLGEVCKRVSEKRPDLVSKLITKLLQSSTDPGASAWGALEAVGTIISTNPSLFGEFTRPLLSFISQESLRREVTWAIGKIAAADPGLAKLAFRGLVSFLDNPDPVLRGYAAWALGNIGFSDVIGKLKKLETDGHTLSIWRDGDLQSVTVAQMAHEAILKISQ